MNIWRAMLLFSLLVSAAPVSAMTGGGLVDLHGEYRELTDYTGKGRWTVVMIWASSCGVCNYEAPHMEAFHRKHRGAQASLLGVSVDGRAGLEDARHFVAEHGLSFPNLVGEAEEVAALFYDSTGTHLQGTPAFLVLDPTGRLRTYQLGAMNVAALERFMQQQTTTAEVSE